MVPCFEYEKEAVCLVLVQLENVKVKSSGIVAEFHESYSP